MIVVVGIFADAVVISVFPLIFMMVNNMRVWITIKSKSLTFPIFRDIIISRKEYNCEFCI